MRLILVLAATAVIAGLASATHTPQGPCDSEGAPALGTREFGGPYGVQPIYYLDDRSLPFGNGMWFYEETNGIYATTLVQFATNMRDVAHDLQRGASSPFLVDDRDLCVDDPAVSPDFLWW